MIKRYEINVDSSERYQGMIEHRTGDYVDYSDHEAEISEKEDEIDRLQRILDDIRNCL